MTYPQNVPDLFDGDQIILVGRYGGSGQTTCSVSGNYGGRVSNFRYPANLPGVQTNSAMPFWNSFGLSGALAICLTRYSSTAGPHQFIDDFCGPAVQLDLIKKVTNAPHRPELFHEGIAEFVRGARKFGGIAEALGFSGVISGQIDRWLLPNRHISRPG